MRYLCDQSNGEHDFDLFCGEGLIGIVECTMATDQQVRQMRARIADSRSGGEFVDARLCKKGWLVHFSQNADPREIRKKVDAYLAPIEDAGIENFFSYTDAANCSAISKILTDLQIESGSVTEWKPPKRRIGLSIPSQGGKVTFDQLEDAVRAEASKPDNRRKLANALKIAERHLFVYVDPNYFLPWKVLVDAQELFPEGFPEIKGLPNEITHLWIATTNRHSSHHMVWLNQKGEGWQGPIELVIEEDE